MDNAVNNGFLEKKKIGKIGETKAANLFKYLKYEFKDVSNNKSWYDKDVDFFIKNKDKKLKIEVKTDSKDYGNILCETIKNTNSRKEGWSLGSEADLILFYKITTHKMIILDLNRLKEFIKNEFEQSNEGNPNYTYHYTYNYDWLYRESYKSKNMVIPTQDLIDSKVIIKIYKDDQLTENSMVDWSCIYYNLEDVSKF